MSDKPSDHLDITPDKACKIVEDGEAHGHKLTEKQRGMFGARCGERKKDLEATVPIMAKNIQQQYKALTEEKKFLQSRWKALKTLKEDEGNKEEKSYITYRWKRLAQEEKKLKSIMDKAQPSSATPSDSFAKKFTKGKKSISEAHAFLKGLGQELNFGDSQRLKSYHYGCTLEKMLGDLLGGGSEKKGLETLAKLLITTKDFPELKQQDNEVNITDPTSPSKYSPGDKLQQWGEGGSLAKRGKKGFEELEKQDREVNVTDPKNPTKIAKLGQDSSWNPIEDGPSLVRKKDFDVLDEADSTVHVTKPGSPSHYSPGKERMQQFGLGGTIVKYLKAMADASQFLKALAYEKAFGYKHQEAALVLSKAMDIDLDKSAMAGFESFFPGDLMQEQQEEDEPEHKGKKDKKDFPTYKLDEMEASNKDHMGGLGMGEEEEEPGMGLEPGMEPGGLSGGMEGGMDGGMGGGLGALGDPDMEDLDPDAFTGKGMKSLDVIGRDTMTQAQVINSLNSSLNKLLASLN